MGCMNRGPYRAIKRGLDLLAALALAPLWGSVLALAALAVRLFDGAPMLFTQERAGLHGRPFRILKLRTMRQGDGPDEQRMTRLGRLLRATSIDELPQLVNVLRGEMSIIGPRPLPVAYLPLYTPAQARRHDVLPGVTGWAQVNGRNAISWERKFELDVEYVERMGFAMDCKIAALTLWRLATAPFRRGGGEPIMPVFEGSNKTEEKC